MQTSFSIEDIFRFLPGSISNILKKLPHKLLKEIEEVRLRLNKPLIVSGCSNEYILDKSGIPTNQYEKGYLVTYEDISAAVQLVCHFSVYSVEDEIRNGFITIDGGHRVGICGKAVLENHNIRTIKDISFLNFRVAKQIIGAADKVIDYLIQFPDSFYNTLIISPPQCGKTTLLRDIIRQTSNGIPRYSFKGKKLGLVDERSEIAACLCGLPRNDIGIRTDVLDGCPKAEGIIMLIRSMSPDIIATDELGKSEDAYAILDAVNAGVKVITTIHGSSLEDFLKKTNLDQLKNNVFERIIILSKRNGVGTIEKILDQNYKEVLIRGNSLCS